MRACDSCRRRKVKCDFKSPQCSTCQLSNLPCAYTVPPRKRGRRFRESPAPTSPSQHSPSISRLSTAPLSPLTNTTFSGAAHTASSWSPPGPGHFPIIPPSAQSLTTANQMFDDINRNQRQTSRTYHFQQDGSRSQLISLYQELESAISRLQPLSQLDQIGSECIDLYLQYLFPIMPLIHERSLRKSLVLFSQDSEILGPSHSLVPNGHSDHQRLSDTSELVLCRQFSLLTAVCAETCFVLPAHIFPKGPKLAKHFLRASRNCLNLQQDDDIESPNSSSIIIRYLHFNSIHAAGRGRVSWQLLGDAMRLAQAMCLHHEHALENLDSVEAQLRRNIFWQLHTGDKSAALLNNRPFVMHDFSLRGHISVQNAPRPDGHSLLDSTRSHGIKSYEDRLMTSFHLCQKLWCLAAKLMLDFQLLQPFCTSMPPSLPVLTEGQTSAIVDTYVQFLSFTDDMPSWLRDVEQIKDVEDADMTYQRSGFWIQRINLQVTFHSLSLLILQRFLDLNLLSLLGLSSEPLMIALKKTEIAREMLQAIQSAPFEFLQINGESCVEKIRQVGASLLEITQTIQNERIVKRAQLELPNLLNILARLDSRASDLKQQYVSTTRSE